MKKKNDLKTPLELCHLILFLYRCETFVNMSNNKHSTKNVYNQIS